MTLYEPPHEKTNCLHMRKQRRRPASRKRDQRLCFRYTDSTKVQGKGAIRKRLPLQKPRREKQTNSKVLIP